MIRYRKGRDIKRYDRGKVLRERMKICTKKEVEVIDINMGEN